MRRALTPLGKQIVLLVVLSTLIVAMVPLNAADARSTREGPRKETQRYTSGGWGPCLTLLPSGVCAAELTFPSGPERYAAIEISDGSGAPVLGQLVQSDEAFGSRFCSATSEPLPITPGAEVRVELFSGTCPDGTPSTPTEGTVTVTFFQSLPLPRTEVAAYSPFYWGAGIGVPGGVITSIVSLAAGPGRWLSMKIEDEAGTVVAADILQGDKEMTICGSTDSPVAVRPNVPFEVHLYAGTCDDGTPSAPTRGTITATFSNDGR